MSLSMPWQKNGRMDINQNNLVDFIVIFDMISCCVINDSLKNVSFHILNIHSKLSGILLTLDNNKNVRK